MAEFTAWLLYKVNGILDAGGIAIVPMFLLGAYGFFLLMQAFTQPTAFRITRMLRTMDDMIRSAQAGKAPGVTRYGNPILRIVTEALFSSAPIPHGTERVVRMLLRERLSFLFYRALRHLAIIRVLAAAAPLLGLLGTVSGLIRTFNAMHRFGFGNSGLLASGISEALLATQCGLALAIILLLIGQFQEGRIMRCKHEVEFRIAALLRCRFRGATNG